MKLIYFIYVVALFTSCINNVELIFAEIKTLKEETREMAENYHHGIAKNRRMAEFDYLYSSPYFYWVPLACSSALSYDPVRNILEINSKNLSAVQYSRKQVQRFPLTKSIVNFSGIADGKMTHISGKTTSISVIEPGTLIKRTDGWKSLSGPTALLNNKS